MAKSYTQRDSARGQPYRKLRRNPTVDAAVAEHGHLPDAVLPVLQTVQASHQASLDTALLGAVADALKLHDARVQGIASFYAMLSTQPRAPKVLRLCDGPVCQLHGAPAARAAIEALFSRAEWVVERWSCLGLCDRAPAALVGTMPCGPIQPDLVGEILEGRCGRATSYADPRPGETRVLMARIGRIDPEAIESAVAAGAYGALALAIQGPPETVLEAVERSGLRGLGGAGFPTGRKWRWVAQATGPQKYVIANADESEPGTFKDRVLMEGDPHLLLEALALAGFAVGASEGIIYIRGEYEWIAQRLSRAVAQAEASGWLGERIRGSSFSFRVQVHQGAGAYICGEETALLESLEGKRGEPRIRPPFPATHGYHGRPTLVNNVETLCQVPAILRHGAEAFRSRGTAGSPGTKIFTVTGCINQPGAFEAPLGITLRQVIEQFGGGMRPGSNFKAALTGGAAGTIVPAALLDVPLDFDSVRQGVALGSGAVLVLDETISIPVLLTWLLHFFEVESCGKCTPCREGTREARQHAERIAARDGRGAALSRGRRFSALSAAGAGPRAGDTDELRRLARLMNATSLCGLGQSVAWPIESALRHFGDEFAPGARKEGPCQR